MLITGYFDDSGTHKGSPVVVWGGLLGRDQDWAALDAKWRDLLREPLRGKPPLKQFHLADCKNGKKEFEGYSEGERDRVTYLFRSIINESTLYSVSMSICTAPWDELIVGRYRERLGNAESAAFASCIGQARDIVKQARPEDGQIALIFDGGRHGEALGKLSQRIVDFKHRGPPEIVHIGFGEVVKFSPLQAADMVATETYWALRDYLAYGDGYKIRPHFQHLLNHTAALGKWLDRAGVEETVARLKAEGIEP